MNAVALYALYAVLAVGAAGVGLSLPRRDPLMHRLRWAGAVLGCAALAGLAVCITRWTPRAFEGRAFFIIFALTAVLAAARVVTHKRPVYSALYFVLVILAVAGLCILAAAEFLAAALVIVYGGAILVTYVFVIMLSQQRGEPAYDRSTRAPLAAVGLGFLLAAAAAQATVSSAPSARTQPGSPAAAAQRVIRVDTASISGPAGNTQAIGTDLIERHVVAVQVAGVLLLIAMIGAIVIARKRIPPQDLTAAEVAARQANDRIDIRRPGREAAPF